MTSNPEDASTGTTGNDGEVASDGASGSICPSLGDASPMAPGRVPMKHRSSGAACTTPRAPETPAPCGCPDGGHDPIAQPDGSTCLCGSCAQDSDCDAGANGRCEEIGPAPVLTCSYDECLTDSDCEGGVPCTCRPVANSQNYCQTGSNCAVDSDCGPGGYCSPSLPGGGCFCLSTALCGAGTSCSIDGNPVPCSCGDSCGHGYFCHTPCDACLDDSDCVQQGGGSCDYDWLDRRWECRSCLPRL